MGTPIGASSCRLCLITSACKEDGSSMKEVNCDRVFLWVRKMAVLVLGVTIMSFGGVFCVKSQIGLAPATVVPYTLNCVFPGISFGTFTSLMNIALIFLQILILRKNFKAWQLLQFIVALLFGVTVDLAVFCLRSFSVSTYAAKCVCTLVGAVLVALGIALEILSESIPAPSDSTVKTISTVLGKQFGNVKTVYDCIHVAVAVSISLIGLGTVVAIREGTLFLALFTGTLVKVMTKRLAWLKKYTTDMGKPVSS